MYEPKQTEKKWQDRWEQDQLYRTDLQANDKPPFYNLTMFPYPSAAALHVGHIYCYGGTDTFGRFKRMQGFNVFEPMGFDAFGINAENYALKIKEHPQKVVPRNIQYFRDEQMKKIGAMFDWSREVNTTDPDYYRWTQWLFLKMYEAGLAYQKESFVDWCPQCQTVLAKEQIQDGKCERCGTQTIQKNLKQWFFRITDYAEALLEGLETLDWPEQTKALQRNWIGKSTGMKLRFSVKSEALSEENVAEVECFTTRPDTIFGTTFLVLSPEHPLLGQITTDQQREHIVAYQQQAMLKDELDRTQAKEKTGVFTGAYAHNPLTQQDFPIWVADYVLMNYGTGAVMGVPAHDQRDFEFATQFSLEIQPVIRPSDQPTELRDEQGNLICFPTKEGVMIHSDFLNDLTVGEAMEEAMNHIEQLGWGERTTTYRLHDWCISRQRYWGPPIPMIHCDQCGPVPVPEKDLPVLLPEMDKYQPDGSGKGPLNNVADFVNTSCPQCGGAAQRETDVSDTFLDSAWYFLRYLSPDKQDSPFDLHLVKKWLPLDMYIGGIEHATMHLLYFRFTTHVLHKMELLPFPEPAKKLRHQGLIIKDGAKMSKSKGNVVNPNEYIQKYGADAFRTYMLFIGPYEEGGDFRDGGILGAVRFYEKIWDLLVVQSAPTGDGSVELSKLHQTIKKVGEDYENLRFNTAIAALMELVNWLKESFDQFSSSQWQQIQTTVPRLIGPLAPHMAEELWEQLGQGYSIHDQPWPEYDEAQLVESNFTLAIQVNGKLRDTVEVPIDFTKDQAEAMIPQRLKLERWLEGKTIRKVIYVPGKLVNVVAS